MRTFLGVILALVLFFVAWFFLSGLLAGMFYLGNQSQSGHPIVSLVNVFLKWFIGPGFGGFVAIFASPQIVKGADASAVHVSFVAVVVATTLLVAALMYISPAGDASDRSQAIMGFFQIDAFVLGARLGNRSIAAAE